MAKELIINSRVFYDLEVILCGGFTDLSWFLCFVKSVETDSVDDVTAMNCWIYILFDCSSQKCYIDANDVNLENKEYF